MSAHMSKLTAMTMCPNLSMRMYMHMSAHMSARMSARMSAHMSTRQGDDVCPDIVTVGKPFGNGDLARFQKKTPTACAPPSDSI